MSHVDWHFCEIFVSRTIVKLVSFFICLKNKYWEIFMIKMKYSDKRKFAYHVIMNETTLQISI